jgi:hypothetical protein
MELYEKVDIDLLKTIIDSGGINKSVRKLLNRYYKRIMNNTILVTYVYSKTSQGRLHAKNGLSLQNFPVKIRHSLAKNIYYDIDMENAQPNLILQYCIKNNIKCEHLSYYVGNREESLAQIQKTHNIDRNQAKILLLQLTSLGEYMIENIEPIEKNDFALKYQQELKNIAVSICKIRDVAENDSKKIISTLGNQLENECLMAMCEYSKNNGLVVGVLCFDGLMIEKIDTGGNIIDLKKIITDCEEYVHDKTGYKIKLSEKEMDMEFSFDLS